MRMVAVGVLGLALTAGVWAEAAAGAGSPALPAKQAEAQVVLRRVNALDVRFGEIVDRWDGARIQLASNKQRLSANERALKRARRRTRLADARLARVLVAIYEDGQPTLAGIVVGASSISDLVSGIEAAQTIDVYDQRVAEQAQRLQATLAAGRVRLRKTEQAFQRTVSQLAQERKQIGAMLARRRRLLASVQSEVAALTAREAARQHALAVAARARLAREQTARIAAARAAAERAATPPSTAAQTTTVVAPPVTTVTTATVATAQTTTATTTTTTTSAATLGPGYPQAAAIALHYLGVPYRWGGASPATGFDCSGLVMYVYAQIGIELPHEAAGQYAYGVAVPRDQLEPGDLVFYDGLSHVGIYIGDGEIVHAPHTGDVVKISPLSQGGATYDGARRL